VSISGTLSKIGTPVEWYYDPTRRARRIHYLTNLLKEATWPEGKASPRSTTELTGVVHVQQSAGAASRGKGIRVSGGQPTEKLPKFGTTSPLGRPGQPAELAPAYVFLVSPESSFVSGGGDRRHVPRPRPDINLHVNEGRDSRIRPGGPTVFPGRESSLADGRLDPVRHQGLLHFPDPK
jgi:hypothetical protein